MNKKDKDILFNILNEEIKDDSIHNLRINGESVSRFSTDEVEIISKKDKNGIDINVKRGSVGKVVQIPVLLTKDGFSDIVYNEFNIEEDSSVTIIAGCAIHNDCEITSMHSGVHTFNIGKNAKVKYIEKHYGCGQIDGNKEINTDTIINLSEGASMEIETVQISGVDKALRKTIGKISNNSKLDILEKLLTANMDEVKTVFEIELNGILSKVNVLSRSVAKGSSKQEFYSEVIGNNVCFGHIECDAILMDDAKVESTPKIVSNSKEAILTHEAVIGKISGDEILKLETLGLTKEESENEILKGFLS